MPQCQVCLNNFIPVYLPQIFDQFFEWSHDIKETSPAKLVHDLEQATNMEEGN